jgi:hypothetical protein
VKILKKIRIQMKKLKLNKLVKKKGKEKIKNNLKKLFLKFLNLLYLLQKLNKNLKPKK